MKSSLCLKLPLAALLLFSGAAAGAASLGNSGKVCHLPGSTPGRSTAWIRRPRAPSRRPGGGRDRRSRASRARATTQRAANSAAIAITNPMQVVARPRHSH